MTVNVEVARDTPYPARIGMCCQLAEVADRVNWLGLGPHENYPDRLTAACFDRWDLSLDDMYTPYVFPTENGLRCGTRELRYGVHQWRGDFQFNISRYSQKQLMDTSHRHLCSLKQAPGSTLMASIWASAAMTPGVRRCPLNSCLVPDVMATSLPGGNKSNLAGRLRPA